MGLHGDPMVPCDLLYSLDFFTAMANARSGENPHGALFISENIAEYS